MTNEINNGDLENWLIAKEALFVREGQINKVFLQTF